MAGVSKKPDKDRPLDFKGFLKDLSDWDLRSEKDQKMKGLATVGKKQNVGNLDDIGPPKKIAASEAKKKAASRVTSSGRDKHYMDYSNAVSQFSSSFLSDEKIPDAASEKELGNEYFKEKKYLEAIECYSRSIALSPTSVAFANRAMAYLKVKRFEEAENDCTEALNLDDRYVKAYARRATARKELRKFKASMEDYEFGLRLEPNNQELQKQHTEARQLLEKETAKNISGASKTSSQAKNGPDNSEMAMKGGRKVHSVLGNVPTAAATSLKTSTAVHQAVGHQKQDLDMSMQDLASRAASRIMATTIKNISAPKSTYEFEVSWRALSGDSEKQACLLKTILPATLPQIFKNALSAPMLIKIIKCTATIFKEDTEFAVSILDNLTKVPRFDMIVMCLSAVDHAEIHRLWEQVFSMRGVQADLVEILNRLRPRFCYGEWQAHIVGSREWPK